MEDFDKKFRLIFLPCLLVVLGADVVYTFLYWAVFLKQRLIVDELTLVIWGSLIVPWIPIIIWVRPRIKLLDMNISGKKDPVLFTLIIVWMATALFFINSQNYIISEIGKLTTLNYMSEARDQPDSKYYQVNHFYPARQFAIVKPVFRVTGKYNTNFDMYIYTAVPVFDHLFPDTTMIAKIKNSTDIRALVLIDSGLSTRERLNRLPADSIKAMRYLNPSMVMPKYGLAGRYGAIVAVTKSDTLIKLPQTKIAPVAWLCLRYLKTVSNRLSPSEKKARYHDFFLQSKQTFFKEPLQKITYMEHVPFGTDQRCYVSAIISSPNVIFDNDLLLLPKFTPFSDRNGNSLLYAVLCIIIGSLLFMLFLSAASLKK